MTCWKLARMCTHHYALLKDAKHALYGKRPRAELFMTVQSIGWRIASVTKKTRNATVPDAEKQKCVKIVMNPTQTSNDKVAFFFSPLCGTLGSGPNLASSSSSLFDIKSLSASSISSISTTTTGSANV